MTRSRQLLMVVGIAVGLAVATETIHGLRWRAHLILAKARGKVGDVTWPELFHMMPVGAGYDLEGLLETGNPNASITNPFYQPEDVQAGARIFHARCAQCHTQNETALTAPNLVNDQFRHGGSDWALYRTIQRGIRGSAMAPQPLSERQRWQVIAYIRATRRDARTAASRRPASVPRLSVPYGRLRDAAVFPEDWLTYSGTYDGHRFSSLRQIHAGNVGRLRLLWVFQFPRSDEKNESSPLVVGNVMYVTASPGTVWALDARTGQPLWEYRRELPDRLALCCGPVNRGLAILDSTLFLGTLSAHLVALDARTGRVRWDVPVADRLHGYSITAAPLALKDRVITGVAGGEFGAPGFIAAYDAATGQPLWTFRTVPGPGEAGNETWAHDSWKWGAAPTWMTGSYDPDLDLLYWGVGNPGPDFTGEARQGRNLYSNSVVALDPETGHLRWYFQLTPHDTHDYDAAVTPVLVDARYAGRRRRMLLLATKNAFFYELDRETGQFLRAFPFEQQTWAEGVDSTGQPIARASANPSDSGTLVFPSATGATNWWPPTFSPSTRLLYVPALHMGGWFYTSSEQAPQHAPERRGDLFLGGASSPALGMPYWGSVVAIDPEAGAIRWQYRLPTSEDAIMRGGLLSTAGGLVLGGDGPTFFALDATTGRQLWAFNCGGKIAAAPVAFASAGQERIAIVAGRAVFVFGLGPS